MRTIVTLAIGLAALGVCQPGVASAQDVTYVPSEKSAAAFVKGGPIVQSEGLLVNAAHRIQPGPSERHANTSHVFVVIDGEALFVTGGRLSDDVKETGPGEWRGSDIVGGVTHHLKKGDVIAIPAGTPHMWKAVPTGFIKFYAVNYKS